MTKLDLSSEIVEKAVELYENGFIEEIPVTRDLLKLKKQQLIALNELLDYYILAER